jgi:hypothetical protein
MNSFSLGAQIGGPNTPENVLKEQQRLRHAFNGWRGEYTKAIHEFAFLLRVDGSIHRYTEMWKIEGAQKAKRKRDWVEVEIGVPQSWWENDQIEEHRNNLVKAIENGLHSIIELLQRNRDEIDADALLRDWEQIKHAFLNEPVSR